MKVMRRRAIITLLAVVGVVGVLSFRTRPVVPAAPAAAENLPASLTDDAFWKLVTDLSEPNGFFRSDNFLSNELEYQWIIPTLTSTLGTGGVYVGVGPEQNFTYIARLRPSMAFVVDIRRENRNLHLLYKALFEISSDRADFVSHLFSRLRPGGLSAGASVEQIFDDYARVPSSPALYTLNAALVRDRLLKVHGFPLAQADLEWIDRAFRAFFTDGPEIQFWGSRSVDRDTLRPSYHRLMTTPDFTGQSRSFLASDASFQAVKTLHARNLIVPVVGDFGGPDAIRRVGEYVRTHGESVRAFYGSNVGVYLTNEQTRAFCRNLASLPAASDAWFIESDGVRSFSSKLAACK
jgi:hypothetical protein